MHTLNTVEQHAVAYSFDSLESNAMKSSNPISGCRKTEISRCLDTSVPDPSKNQGGIVVIEVHSNRTPSERLKDKDKG